MVTGNVNARGYINNNGEAAASLDLRAREVRFLGGRGDQGGGGGGGGYGGGQQQRGGYQGGQGGGQQRGGYQQQQGNQAPSGGYQQDDRASNYPESRPQTSDDIPF